MKLVGNDAAGIHGLQPVAICTLPWPCSQNPKIPGGTTRNNKDIKDDTVTPNFMITPPGLVVRRILNTQSNRSNPRLTLISLSSVCPRSFNLASLVLNHAHHSTWPANQLQINALCWLKQTISG